MTFDLFLCGYKGAQLLKAICMGGYQQHIGLVVGAKDLQMENDHYDEIRKTCEAHGINFTGRTGTTQESTADFRFAAGWRWMLAQTHNTIIFHDALLPAYRGFAPLVNALINGDKFIGATALFASKNYDAGPVILSERIPVEHPIRIARAIEEISKLYIKMALRIIQDILSGKELSSSPQEESIATYSLWRDEQDYNINWQEDSERILRTVYALSHPYRGARTVLNGNKISVEDAVRAADRHIVTRQPGKVIFLEDGLPVVVCGRGMLKITGACDLKGVSVLPLKKFRSRFG